MRTWLKLLAVAVLAVCVRAHAQAPTVNLETGDLGPYCATVTGSDFAWQVVCTPPNSTAITSGDALFTISYYGNHGTAAMHCAQPALVKSSALYPLIQLSAASASTLTVYAASGITTNANAMTFSFICAQY